MQSSLYSRSDESRSLGSKDDFTNCDDDDDYSRRESLHIGVKETRNVQRLRIVLCLVLMISAVGIACTAYYITSSNEVMQFQRQFQDDAFKIFEAIGAHIDNTLGSIDILSVSIVSQAKALNESWPFVTIRDFPVQASKVRSMSESIGIFLANLVEPEQRTQWEKYSWSHRIWVNQSMDIQQNDPNYYGPVQYNDSLLTNQLFSDEGVIPYNMTDRNFLPQWQNYPASARLESPFNWDALSQVNPVPMQTCLKNREVIIREAYMLPDPNNPEEMAEYEYWVGWYSDYVKPGENPGEPISDMLYPVMAKLDAVNSSISADEMEEYPAVGIIVACIYWRAVLKGILPNREKGIIAVFDNPCCSSFTYQINGPDVVYIGRNDLHDSSYNRLGIASAFHELNSFSSQDSTYSGVPIDMNYCQFTITLYPSDEMKNEFTTNTPYMLAGAIIIIFLFTSLVFFLYNYGVERRQRLVYDAALTSTTLVSSLFPSNVRDQVLETTMEKRHDNNNHNGHDNGKKGITRFNRQHFRKKQDEELEGDDSERPLARLYQDTTVFFGDIAGFTAWSASRDPSQVFILLETIYGDFDKIAKKRNVFKIETIGDCYVAAAGLPEPNRKHSVSMVRFACDCLTKMNEITQSLKTRLGPDTVDLMLRIGLNSGATTAGVLRGDRARFQLFGDTVNTAARMECLGSPGRIHISQSTADYLIASGKLSWINRREDPVEAKGKGMMVTYWIKTNMISQTTQSRYSDHSERDLDDDEDEENEDDINPLQESIEYNVNVFETLLKRVVASRDGMKPNDKNIEGYLVTGPTDSAPIDELTDRISVRNQIQARDQGDIQEVILDDKVKIQLRQYVTTISQLYKNNCFHNFSHATHVVKACLKLLQQLKTEYFAKFDDKKDIQSSKGKLIFLDPLIELGMVFSALIHDVDHPGVPNSQLVEDVTPIAKLYRNKSVAEQNSIDIAWKLLMLSDYTDLTNCICPTMEDRQCFRQVVVNAVVATDMFDSELRLNRENRFEKVRKNDLVGLSSAENLHEKLACIVDHIVQASDIIHTMQDWDTYIKWNQHLLEERNEVYESGYGNVNPTEIWYEGELSFFDNYVIPLVNKIKLLGVMGASCDQLLEFAISNRRQWQLNGQEVVQQFQTNKISRDSMNVPQECSPLGTRRRSN